MALRVLSDCYFDGDTLHEQAVCLRVEGGRIEALLGPDAPATPGDAVLDARGSLLLPGLINAHVHLTRGGSFRPDEVFSPLQLARDLRNTLAAGVTTVGDMGATSSMVGTLRAQLETSPLDGPRVIAAGPVVTAPAGYPLNWLPPAHVHLGVACTAGDARAAREAVTRIAEQGMDFVKLMIQHEDYAGRPLTALGVETARAAVDEAHRLGLRAYAHAVTAADYGVALDAGVDALMHACFDPMSDELVQRVADAGVPVCPTLWVFEGYCLGVERCLHKASSFRRQVSTAIARDWDRFAEAYAESGDVVPGGIAQGLSKARAREGVRVAAANVMLLRDAGVPFAFGNDAAYGLCVHGRPVDELSALTRAGLTPLEALTSATTGAAALLGLGDRGRLAPGQLADLVCVDRRTLRDVRAIEGVRWVVRGGELVPTDLASVAKSAVKNVRAGVEGALRTALNVFRR
ncbi:MAG: amidohydrolase family protein [Planctomycetes bacterium]|nr:amidohydrolase family protein [Planctomycetota bacterium]